MDTLFSLAYDELRRIAKRVRGSRAETLSTTAIVHEAYLKLAPSGIPVKDRAHFKKAFGPLYVLPADAGGACCAPRG